MAFDAPGPIFVPDRQVTRRTALSLFVAVGFASSVPAARASQRLEPPAAPSKDRYQRVKVALEIQGELKLNADGKKPTTSPLQVTCKQSYLERLPAPDSPLSRLAALRQYDLARADFQIGRSNHTTELDETRRLIALQAQDGRLLAFSPHSPLHRPEADLLDIPCNTAVIHQLLPRKSTGVGETWTASDLTWAQLLGLDTLQQNQVQFKIDRWEGDAAMIVAEGTLQGSVGGVATDLDVKGKLQFDRTTGRITWIALGLNEDRAIGHAEPGYKVTMRLRASLEPTADAGPLADRAVTGLPLDLAEAGGLVVLPADRAGLRLLTDRRWRLMTHRPDRVVLRLVDRGDLVAQCNLSPLPPLAAGRQLSLEEFQDDIRQSLGESFQQFADAQQGVEAGRRQLRVVALGQASELPIQWIYYHISDDQGRRAAAVFTIESELVERFAEADRPLLAGVEFVAPPPELVAATPPKKEGPAPTTSSADSTADAPGPTPATPTPANSTPAGSSAVEAAAPAPAPSATAVRKKAPDTAKERVSPAVRKPSPPAAAPRN